MKVRIFQTILLCVTVLAGTVACGGSDTAPNGMTANDILAMSRNASASINTLHLYMTATMNTMGETMTLESYTSEDKSNHRSFSSLNMSMTSTSMTIHSEVYTFNNSLYVYRSSKEEWIQTQSPVDYWDQAQITSLYQTFDNLSTDANYTGIETIGGIDCYKISLKYNLADAENILEYLGIDTSEFGDVTLPDLKCAYWIDENTYYIMKVSVTGNMVIEGVSMSLSEVGTYSYINQPVYIALPQAAKDAPTISYSDYMSGNW